MYWKQALACVSSSCMEAVSVNISSLRDMGNKRFEQLDRDHNTHNENEDYSNQERCRTSGGANSGAEKGTHFFGGRKCFKSG